MDIYILSLLNCQFKILIISLPLRIEILATKSSYLLLIPNQAGTKCSYLSLIPNQIEKIFPI